MAQKSAALSQPGAAHEDAQDDVPRHFSDKQKCEEWLRTGVKRMEFTSCLIPNVFLNLTRFSLNLTNLFLCYLSLIEHHQCFVPKSCGVNLRAKRWYATSWDENGAANTAQQLWHHHNLFFFFQERRFGCPAVVLTSSSSHRAIRPQWFPTISSRTPCFLTSQVLSKQPKLDKTFH